jgi:two-component system chemotaxis response regulator CheY
MDILIVDDQRTTGLALAWTLTRLGHEPRLATSGEEAWGLIERDDWRIVITDWMMPVMDGLELCRRIRSRRGRPYIYTIVLTGRTAREDRLEALKSGPDDFLTKPVDPDELALRIAIARRILDVQAELEEKNALLGELASTDPLTGLANRRGLRASIEDLACRIGPPAPLSVLAIDVDHFKSYNDDFGHAAGDATLRRVAAVLLALAPNDALVARIGGEEFLALLPGADVDVAVDVAESLRLAIASSSWTPRTITISVGVATAQPAWKVLDVSALMEDADRALYHSKRTGRDRVTHIRDKEEAGSPNAWLGRAPCRDDRPNLSCWRPDSPHDAPRGDDRRSVAACAFGSGSSCEDTP